MDHGKQQNLLQQVRDEADATLPSSTDELARLRGHSEELNALCWRMAQLLGDVGPDDTQVEADPFEQLERLARIPTTEQVRDVVLEQLDDDGIEGDVDVETLTKALRVLVYQARRAPAAADGFDS